MSLLEELQAAKAGTSGEGDYSNIDFSDLGGEVSPSSDGKEEGMEGVTRMPDMATKGQIKEASDNAAYNFTIGSATGNIETVGLIGSLSKWLMSSGADKMLAGNPAGDALKNIIKQGADKLGETDIVKASGIEEIIDSPLDFSTKIMEGTQEALGADVNATSTNVGEFLTPDVLIGGASLVKGLGKLTLNNLKLGHKKIGDTREYFYEIASGLDGVDISKDVKFLKENPVKALEQMKLSVSQIDDVVTKMKEGLPKFALKEKKQIDEFRDVLLKENVEQSSLLKANSASEVDRGAALLESYVGKIGKTVEDAEKGLGKIGTQYDNFVGIPSKTSGANLADNFYNDVISKFPGASKDERTMLTKLTEEIKLVVDTVASKNSDGMLKYEDLKQIRQNFDKNINWEDISKSTTNKFGKKVRNFFDDKYIAGDDAFKISKTLDAEYKAGREALDELKSLMFDKTGKESTSIRGKIKNLYKPENKGELTRMAKLLDIDEVSLKAISKQISADLGSKAKKTGVNPESITYTKNSDNLGKAGEILGIKDTDKIIEKIERSTLDKKSVEDLVEAVRLDKKDGTSDNLIGNIFRVLDGGGNKKVATEQLIEDVIGKDAMLRTKILKSIVKSTDHPGTRTIASLGFNVSPITQGLGLLDKLAAPVLKLLAGDPNKALKAILERAVRVDAREAKAIEKAILTGKELSPTYFGRVMDILKDMTGGTAYVGAQGTVDLITED